MVGPRPRDERGADATDEFGTRPESDRYTAATFLSALVPTALARRAITVSLETNRTVYERGDPVELTVEFKNRSPLPVSIPTPRRRRWGWTFDGLLEATDERVFTRKRPSAFEFHGGERKRTTVTWNGRLKRTTDDRADTRYESLLPDAGEYELRAFVATHEGRYQPSDSTTIRLE